MEQIRRKQELYVEQMKYERKIVKEKLENQQITIQNLRDRLNKNSSNSSIPSSAEKIYTKKKCTNTSRQKTVRKTGGQIGHKGSGLTKEKAETLIKSGKVEHAIEEHVFEGVNERI